MRAFTNRKYGDASVLRLEALPAPTPKAGQVLVQVHATALTGGDMHLMRGDMFAVRLFWGLWKPRKPILGFALSGVVTQVGPGVTACAPGDAVMGMNIAGGGFAEQCVLPVNNLIPKPAALTHVQASCLPVTAPTSLQALRAAPPLQPGQRVLINGASGGTGSYAVQLAKRAGAEVTGIAGPSKQDYLRELGADHALDYTAVDFVTRPERYDLFVDFVGNRTIAECKRVLSETGTYMAMAGKVSRTLRGTLFGGKQFKAIIAKDTAEDLQTVTDMALAGELTIPVTQTFAFEDTPAALTELLKGHARGKLVIDFQPAD